MYESIVIGKEEMFHRIINAARRMNDANVLRKVYIRSVVRRVGICIQTEAGYLLNGMVHFF
jgi:hypothetical protein